MSAVVSRRSARNCTAAGTDAQVHRQTHTGTRVEPASHGFFFTLSIPAATSRYVACGACANTSLLLLLLLLLRLGSASCCLLRACMPHLSSVCLSIRAGGSLSQFHQQGPLLFLQEQQSDASIHTKNHYGCKGWPQLAVSHQCLPKLLLHQPRLT